MSIRSSIRLGAVIALLPVLTTCDRGTDPPVPGWLNVALTSPNTDAGVRVTITGGRVDSARTTSPQLASEHLFWRKVSDTEFRLIVGAGVSTGSIAQVWVPDLRKVSSYTAVVAEAAAPTTYAQRALAGYSATLVAP